MTLPIIPSAVKCFVPKPGYTVGSSSDHNWCTAVESAHCRTRECFIPIAPEAEPFYPHVIRELPMNMQFQALDPKGCVCAHDEATCLHFRPRHSLETHRQRMSSRLDNDGLGQGIIASDRAGADMPCVEWA